MNQNIHSISTIFKTKYYSALPPDQQAALVGRAPVLDAARGRGGGGRGGPRRQDHGHLHQEPQPQVSVNKLTKYHFYMHRSHANQWIILLRDGGVYW